jgi:aminopeptidase YwaD
LAYSPTDLFRRNYRSDLAHHHVVAISQHHRIQGSPGFRAAANYVAGQTVDAGLEVAIRRYPADGRHSFWAAPGFLEWSCENATLAALDQDGAPSEILCDFAAVATSLIQRSIPVAGDFEVLALPGRGGLDPTDYCGIDVAGRLVLTDKDVARVHHIAVRQFGAAGILFDGMSLGGRTDLDLPDARQYTSFWWAGGTAPDGWGFVLSPRQGRRLRSELSEGRTVRLRAAIQSRFYAGSFEVVDALIPGLEEGGEEVLLVSHLCHPRPGAHDNGSGAAALIETAGMLKRLIASGSLPPPRRGIRFLWLPEMTGTFAWCAENEADLRRGRWIAGLNLDMVGADQCRTGSTWELVDLPEAAASYADHLLAWLREPLLDGQRYRESRFGAGSDHYILSDPTVGIPTPMLSQWPDRFYHTSADTPDKVSSESLGRSGVLAAAYAFWLASAGEPEARWLGHWMVTRFAEQAGRDSAKAAERLQTGKSRTEAARHLAEHRRRSEFRTARMLAALDTLVRLDSRIASDLPELRAAVHEAGARELRWLDAQSATYPPSELLLDSNPAGASRPPQANGIGERPEWSEPVAEWQSVADHLVPRRLIPGPVDAAMALQAQGGGLLPAFWAMIPSGLASGEFHDLIALAQYWVDGCRSIAEITNLVSLEAGWSASDLLSRYFRLLAQAGLFELHEPG